MQRHHPVFALLLTSALLGTSGAGAQTFEDLQNHVGAWLQQVDQVYRFNTDALMQIWQAYCEDLDSEINDRSPIEAATKVGQDLQQRQAQNLTAEFKELADLRTFAAQVQAAEPNFAQNVDELLADMSKSEENLKKLQNGVVLQGSNHPFVQLAIKYGVEQHERLCEDSSYTGKVNVCDRPFDTLSDRRPDLVTVKDDGLWVYEFKPEGRAEQAGWKQLSDYVPGVLKYYQQFFPNGRTGATDGKPDDDLGGQAMLDALVATDNAWESDGTKLKVPQSQVVTYHRCERPPEQ